jgi:hypothetical protein
LTFEELEAEIAVELEAMESTVNELLSLQRHVAFHGYGFQLEWGRMAEGVARIQNVFSQFRSSLSDYMKSIKD